MEKDILIERIKERLAVTGLSAAGASIKAGLSKDAIRNIYRGNTKSPTTENLSKIAKALSCDLLYLTGSIDTPNRTNKAVTINVVGYVGAGGEMLVIDDHAKGAGLDTIDAPAGTDPSSVAVIVRGNSMYPIYQDGTVMIYHDCQSDPTSRINKLSVVRVTDGRIMLKTLQNGSQDGLYTLISFNAPPITDVKLDWASRIDWIKPA